MEARPVSSHIIPENLDYPVICFSRDASVVVARDAFDLTRCSATAFWKNRYFEDLLVVDSAGWTFRVESARPDPDVGVIDRYVAQFLNRRLRVSLRLKADGRMALAEIKRALVASIERAPDLLEGRRALAEWSHDIASCRSVLGLARVLDAPIYAPSVQSVP